jgi:hypothetical protein
MTFSIELEPDGEKLAWKFNRFGQHIDDFSDLWPSWGGVFKEDMGAQFATEGAYLNASRWKPLSPAYKLWKTIHYPGRGIGHLTGRLMTSLTGGGGYTETAEKHRGAFGMSDHAEAGRYAGRFAKLRPIPLTRRRSMEKYEKVTHKWVVEAARAAELGTMSGLTRGLYAHGSGDIASRLRTVMT